MRLPPARAVWISASTFAKCVRVPPGAVRFLYCHSPTRFLWDTDRYVDAEVSRSWLNRLVRLWLPRLRRVDREAARRCEHLVVNSENIRRRVEAVYGRESTVIHPPVEVERLPVGEGRGGPWLVVSRLVGYKQIDLAVRAFSGLDGRLEIVGDGPDRARLEAMAPANVHFLGHLPEADLIARLSGARGLVFPGEEDFGIAPVEAMACGRPVVAFARGGALETVIDGETGVWFAEATVEALRAAIQRAERADWDKDRIRRHAEGYSEAVFQRRMRAYMEDALDIDVTGGPLLSA